MHSLTKKVFFNERAFDVCDNVYEPAEDSFLFAENLRVNQGENVLDMGTGCGILGILAARYAREVLAMDLNPYAVRCAKQNALANGVRDRMLFLQGDLFSSIKETEEFDVILFNAPYLPAKASETNSWLELAWAGGKTGRQVIDRFITQAPNHLKPRGKIFLMQSTLANVEETRLRFANLNLETSAVAESALPFFETLVLLEAKSRDKI
jgi:release factor glutamine methyltransferase